MQIFQRIFYIIAILLVAICNITYAAESNVPENNKIKVGILHSLSGTMAISETTLKDTLLMLIEETNKNGGLLGKQIEPVVVNPASNWDEFAKLSRQLLTVDKVDVIFGCWTSVSRKKVKPVVEELNGLLFYPVQYEGQEQSPNIYYTGATPNQQAIPAVEYLMSKEGGGAQKFYLVATDYVYPRTTNYILKAFLKSKNIADEDIKESYTDFGNKDWNKIVAEIKSFASDKKVAVISTINGDANIYFYNELAKQNITSDQIPVIAFSVGEEELSSLDVSKLVGHLTSWNYFMSLENSINEKFITQWRSFIKNDLRVTNDPMEATYIGFKMWSEAVKKAGTTEVAKVKESLGGLEIDAPSGYKVRMDPANHHLHKPVFIGEIKADGQMNVVNQTSNIVEPANWSPYIKKIYVEKGGEIKTAD